MSQATQLSKPCAHIYKGSGVNPLTKLLIEKGVITQKEVDDTKEAQAIDIGP